VSQQDLATLRLCDHKRKHPSTAAFREAEIDAGDSGRFGWTQAEGGFALQAFVCSWHGKPRSTMNASIDSELAGLFGRWTFATAQVRRLDELNIDPDAIKAAAQRVIEERGHPERQRAIVDALDEDTAVALCIWLRDPANASGLLKQARATSRKRR
jgi:hypothetical protein